MLCILIMYTGQKLYETYIISRLLDHKISVHRFSLVQSSVPFLARFQGFQILGDINFIFHRRRIEWTKSFIFVDLQPIDILVIFLSIAQSGTCVLAGVSNFCNFFHGGKIYI